MDSLSDMRFRYLYLTDEVLPSIAKSKEFPVRKNHCFWRIILDNLFQCCWYQAIGKKGIPAYMRLSEEQLQQAIDLAEGMVSGSRDYVRQLNQNSLDWRKAYRATPPI